MIGRSSVSRFLVRRLLPAAVIVPIVLGWLSLEGQRAGLYGTQFGVALMTAANVLISSALVLWGARLLDRLDVKRRQAEQKYRSIFESAVEGIFQTTLDGRLLTANPAVARMFGYESPEEMKETISDIGRQLWMSADGWTSYVRRLCERGVVVGDEIRMKRKDGSVVWVSANARALNDAEGKTIALEVTLKDITERRRGEEALRKSGEQFRSLIQNSSDIITLLDVDGTIRYESPSIERILGYRPGQLVGHNAFDYVHPEDLERLLEVFAEGLANPKLRPSVEYRFRHKDGSWRWLESIGANLLDDPDVGELVVNSRDITERKEAERKLKEAEERYRTLVEQIPAVVYINPLSETSHSIYISPQVKELLGYSVEESREDPELWDRILHPDDRERVIAEERRTSATGEPFRMEYRMIARGGRVVWVRDEAVLVRGQGGRPRFWQGVIFDITERKEAEERYRTLVERIPAITYIQVPAEPSRTTYISPQYETILGYSTEEALKNPEYWYTILHPEDRERVLAEDRRTNETGEPFVMEYRQIAKDGRVVWLRDEATLVRNGAVTPAYWLGVKTDITERKEVEEALREAEQRFRSSFRDAAVGMALVGTDGRWLQVNRSLCEITGYSEEELLAKTFQDITHPDDLEADLNHVRRLLAGEIDTFQMEKRYLHKEGRAVWVLLSVSLMRDTRGDPRYFISQIQDINDRKRIEAKLQHQASHDPLTGLPNRVLFTDRLRHALTRTAQDKRPIAVLFMDLDDFKVVNDSLGHETGDRLLVIVARRLQACLSPGDMIGRLGGDEFAVLLEDLSDAEYPTMVARRIIEELRTPFAIEGREVFVSASIGIAISGVAEHDRPEVLMRDADAAMYAAKGMGRSRHAVFDQSMNRRALRRLDLENDLRRAVEREEFTLHYQPKISIETGEVVGMEALVRWEHPVRGLAFPGEFIWFAEETGLIVPIGKWALREASRQAKEWQDQRTSRTPLTMSVNLSAKQFEHPELTRDVAEILDEIGLDPCRLELEITESVLMDDAPLNAKIMRELKALGVKLSIDDFGTGYSSLSYLKRFPVEYLKIDRSFVGKLGEDPDDTALVSGVIGLAHTLSFEVVAEGVEAAEQLAKLREAGCDLAQGYYLSKPLPSEAAKTLLDKRFPLVDGHP